MQLRSIAFYGFKALDRIAEVEFSESQTSIIFGGNGSGKTTFLKLINAVLSKNEVELTKNQVIHVSIAYESNENIMLVSVPSVNDFTDDSLVKWRYDWTEFDNSELSSLRSLSLGVDRGVALQTEVYPGDIYRFLMERGKLEISRQRLTTIAEELTDYLKLQSTVRRRNRVKRSELQLERDHALLNTINTSHIEDLLVERYDAAKDYASHQIQNALFETLAIAIDTENNQSTATHFPSDLGEQIVAGKNRIIEALQEGGENNFKSRIIRALENISSAKDVGPIIENPILSQLIWNMIKELKVEKQLLYSINVLVETLNYFLGEGKEIVINGHGVKVEYEGETFSIDSLSSGERQLFTFLSLVVIDGRDRDILLIDEPEISLNATWQRKLVKLLEELAPRTQIILASHSPIVAKGQPSSLVELKPRKLTKNDQ
ncbi:AAA family ATPase [Pseudomonas viridiflava]|uniref:AAA family ATPase n=1 Tax=Pseudomonas viridiflava TaxID=33069 RepID=UPI000F069637|nr:AAA family ATPase [Pseudomonas viridiflava]